MKRSPCHSKISEAARVMAFQVVLLSFFAVAAAKAHEEARPRVAETLSHGADRAVMSDTKLAAAKIVLEAARPATLRDNLILNGLVRPNQEKLVQVTPRFAGIVRQVQKSIGDHVRRDELLAKVESNQSLTSYDLKAPIDGTVIDRQISLGEYASEQKPAFVVADLSSVWVDFSVYMRDLARVRTGDQIDIDAGDNGETIRAQVSYISPVGSMDTQSALARAVIQNTNDRMRPGLFVRGALRLGSRNVALAVKTTALQTMEGKTVVFVREGEALEARPVRLGDQDRDFAEVLNGLEEGEMYASENSFVVKAEIGKSEAGHDHD